MARSKLLWRDAGATAFGVFLVHPGEQLAHLGSRGLLLTIVRMTAAGGWLAR
jgi:hypothetical protein